MLKDKKLVIFDLDGTLIDSAISLHKALNYMLSQLNLEPVTVEQTREYIGNGAQILVKRAIVKDFEYQKYNIDSELVDRGLSLMLDYYRDNLTDGTKLYDGVAEVLETLKSKGYLLAIATNKPYEFVGDILKYFNLDRYFNSVVGAGLVKNKKPQPDMLLKILKDLDIKSSEAVIIGDSKNDLLAGERAGVDTVILSYGYWTILRS